MKRNSVQAHKMSSAGGLVAVMVVSILFSCQSVEALSPLPPLQTVEYVDLSRYVGTWYEIARYPNRYQDSCVDGTATFSLRSNAEIDILNSCHDKNDGRLHHTNGHGWVVEAANNARLKFSYFWPFRNEYLIISQGKEYEYSVIATHDRKHLWIIARSQSLPGDLFETILQQIEKQGFNRNNLILDKPIHPAPVKEVAPSLPLKSD